jgi:hypothetical protein
MGRSNPSPFARPEHVCARPNFYYTTAPTNLSRGNVAQKEIIYFPVICAVCLLKFVRRCGILSMSVRESLKGRGKKDLRKSKKPLDKPPKMCYNEYIKGREKVKVKKRFSKKI